MVTDSPDNAIESASGPQVRQEPQLTFYFTILFFDRLRRVSGFFDNSSSFLLIQEILTCKKVHNEIQYSRPQR